MLVMLLFSLLSIAAVLATASIIATWSRYAASWDAVASDLRGGQAAPAQMPKVKVWPPAVRSRPGRRVAA